jgi:HSP20 family protein
VDVLDHGNALVVLVEVAGLAASDLRVEVEGNVLQVKGRRRLAFGAPGRVRFHCLERQEGGFVRRIELLEPVDFRNALVRLADGVLRIELPKVEERRRRVVTLTIEEPEEEPPHEP